MGTQKSRKLSSKTKKWRRSKKKKNSNDRRSALLAHEKKRAHKKNSVTDVRGKKEVVKKYSSVWAHLKVNGPKFGMIIKMVFFAKMVKKKAHSLFPENYLTPIFTCPMVT